VVRRKGRESPPRPASDRNYPRDTPYSTFTAGPAFPLLVNNQLTPAKGVCALSLSRLTAHAFPLNTKIKGEDLWRNDCVRNVDRELDSAEFRVMGSMMYCTLIHLHEEAKVVVVECTCPHFEGGNACKHIWASILEASEKNMFPLNENESLAVELSDEITDFREDVNPFQYAHSEANTTPRAKKVSWKDQIAKAQKQPGPERESFNRPENNKVIGFAIDLPNSVRQKQIQLRFVVQEHLKNGTLGVLKYSDLSQDSLRFFPEAEDRRLLQAVLGRTQLNTSYSYHSYSRGVPGVSVPSDYAERLLAEISRNGKLYVQETESYSASRSSKALVSAYRFDPEKWRLELLLQKEADVYLLSACLKSASQRQELDRAVGFADRFIFFTDFMAASDLDRTFNWTALFLKNPSIEIPEKEVNAFLEMYLNDRSAPHLELPPEIQFAEVLDCVPQARLVFSNLNGSTLIRAQLMFKYGDVQIRVKDVTQHIYDVKSRQRLRRNAEAEHAAILQFAAFEPLPSDLYPAREHDVDGYFHERAFLQAVEQALKLGWEVVANEKRVQSGTAFEMRVSSGVDWFDVNADFDFQGIKMSLPELLPHLDGQQRFIQLGDGSYGLLPQEWIKRFAPLAEMGQQSAQGLRLNRVQALFLASDLQDNEKFKADRKFSSLREIIEQLNGLRAKEAPAKFKGKLRGYQKIGLSWLSVIAKNEIGGILADDMGLGKTVQVLALIGAKQLKAQGPHLIVAPKSLVFNWLQEARKFAPHLKFLNLTGAKRERSIQTFAGYDVVITTYQTLRSDIELMRQVRFDCFILDEAHFAKNPKSQAAMACRLIQAKRKFALTGTPVENSLTDLFSILAIVNPGLLSESHAQSWAKEKDPEAFQRLGRALKPFILRRTKEHVLKDLPAKSEQILFCELSEAERKRYDELRTYFWSQLSDKVGQKGLGRSKIDVLEALLRLRQASCHQGLLDNKLRGEVSTKFDLLLEQLEAVIQDGRKALVFSQFTSLLELLKIHLRERDIPFEYLDGQTRDREQCVARFQTDDRLKVFLLSLKAGGVGLNLTSADYVFILDPWWNPAAETQAIDRTHRIGQKNKVFAYKIIAKDTVEEKILALQESKKQLAKAVISDEKSILKNLTFEDLRGLFS